MLSNPISALSSTMVSSRTHAVAAADINQIKRRSRLDDTKHEEGEEGGEDMDRRPIKRVKGHMAEVIYPTRSFKPTVQGLEPIVVSLASGYPVTATPPRAVRSTQTAAASLSSQVGQQGIKEEKTEEIAVPPLSKENVESLSTVVQQLTSSGHVCLAQLMTFVLHVQVNLRKHPALFEEVMKTLEKDAELRKDLMEYETVLDPTAMVYGKKPSAIFLELIDPRFPATEEYDQIVFMRQFVGYAVTRLQLVRDLIPSKCMLLENELKAWVNRAYDYM